MCTLPTFPRYGKKKEEISGLPRVIVRRWARLQDNQHSDCGHICWQTEGSHRVLLTNQNAAKGVYCSGCRTKPRSARNIRRRPWLRVSFWSWPEWYRQCHCQTDGKTVPSICKSPELVRTQQYQTHSNMHRMPLCRNGLDAEIGLVFVRSIYSKTSASRAVGKLTRLLHVCAES